MPKLLSLQCGPVTFTVPFYEEFLSEGGKGVFPRHLGCHALWYYYCCCLQNLEKMKQNFVYEDEASHIFNVEKAQQLIRSVSNMYGVPIGEMVKFWELMDRQTFILGGKDVLPEEYKFRFSMRN